MDSSRLCALLLLAALAGSPGGGAAAELHNSAPPPKATSPAVREQAGLTPLRGRNLLLLVPAAERDRPEFIQMVIRLSMAAREMAARVPVDLPEYPSTPFLITVAVEPDYTAQGLHAGEIGEAVRGRKADLHLVYHPDDFPAYRYALAGVLLDRAGLAAKLPLEIARGAALWLSRDWYGKPYSEWLPLLSAARVLPSTEEMLAREEPGDASKLLSTPAAAAVVDRLPGATLKEKLASLPSQAKVSEILSSLSQQASPSSTRLGGEGRPFLKGISLAMLNSLDGGYHAPAVEKELDTLSKLGADAVSLMPFAFQRGPDQPELHFLNRRPASETDIGLIHAARAARARGMRVLWKPHIWVAGASWTGEIAMKSEEGWAAWWRSYRRYVLHHALLARWARADLFCVGVELSKTVGREAEWRDLIAAVRLFYPGPVTYAANWYGDLETVHFWDRLDYIGVDAYFPLTEKPGAGKAELEQGARRVAERLARASRRFNKPILLTEVGFAAKKEAWIAPHAEGGPYSEEDQAAAYEALLGALGRPSWLAGAFVWKAFSAPGANGRLEADFRFQGRKAEGVIHRYYGGDPRR